MRRGKLWLITFLLLTILIFEVQAQKPSSKKTTKKTEVKKSPTKETSVKKAVTKPVVADPPPDVVEDQKKIRNIVSVLEFMLNTLGSSTATTRDKEVLVTESYSKIFRDSKVQIEDDLVEDRLVVTNKDVIAYLKDVDFFFTDATFEFAIDNIQNGTNADNKNFYKVALTRHLKGSTTDGKPVNNTLQRFIEINYDPDSQDLKIVSIYTTEFSGKDVLTNWWKQLSYEWQAIFKKKLNFMDSVTLTEMKIIADLQELDLSHNQYITNLDPLAYLSKLKSLNLSYTSISDLVPIRNLTEVTELNLAHTKIQDVNMLKYSSNLVKMNISHTDVSDISVIEKMPHLQYLEMGNTNITDITPIANLTELLFLNLEATKVSNLSPLQNLVQITDLNLSQTPIQDIAALGTLKKVITLDIDSTHISAVTSLSALENLKVLHANYTLIADLQPLQKLPHLEKIYCDQTPVKQPAADAFMATNPKVLVIYDSKDLKSWWDSIQPEWQEVLSKAAKVGPQPTKEELARVTNEDSINVDSNSRIRDLEPLRKLQKLTVIIVNSPEVSDLTPLKDHTEIKYLDISGTRVSDVSAVSKFIKLKVLRADKSKIENIAPLLQLAALEKIYADQTGVQDFIVGEFLEKNRKCLIIYKTIHVDRWWKNLSEDWKTVFRNEMKADTISSRENLHKLVERDGLHINDSPIKDLTALNEFVLLKELHFSGTGITEIPPMENFKSLTSLHATNSPMQSIQSIGTLANLEDLDISSTPIDDLKPIESLRNLKKFSCAGTQVKKLDPLVKWQLLESLDCSNSRVVNLDPLLYVPLKTLKCFNTKVSTREIESFKKKKPECNVVYYR